jgi:hypothetical protein
MGNQEISRLKNQITRGNLWFKTVARKKCKSNLLTVVAPVPESCKPYTYVARRSRVS